MTPPKVTSLPAQRRRQARQWERAVQIDLAAQLAELNPASVFWTAVDNQPWSKVAGILRKRRGCRCGVPDLLILHKGTLIGLELKSRSGRVSRAQKEVRLEMLRAGGLWFLVRNTRGALVALNRCGIRFRRRWTPPVLEPWEEPVADPEQPMVWHPEVLRQWRADKERWRLRQANRARETAKLAAERDDATGADVAA
jgi:hypothetical protein